MILSTPSYAHLHPLPSPLLTPAHASTVLHPCHSPLSPSFLLILKRALVLCCWHHTRCNGCRQIRSTACLPAVQPYRCVSIHVNACVGFDSYIDDAWKDVGGRIEFIIIILHEHEHSVSLAKYLFISTFGGATFENLAMQRLRIRQLCRRL